MQEIIYHDATLMPFGKFRGVALGNVEPDYLIWLYENSEQGKRLSDAKLARYISENLHGLKLEIEAKRQRKFYERR